MEVQTLEMKLSGNEVQIYLQYLISFEKLMTQFFITPENWKPDSSSARLEGDEARHAAGAFRKDAGDAIRIFNGAGDAALGRVVSTSKSAVEIAIDRRLPRDPEPSLHVTVAQSLVPNETMDEIIRQTTEIGVSRILPVASDRSIIKLDKDKRRIKVEHWRKTALAACKQCDRNTLPEVCDVITGRDLADRFGEYDAVLVACPQNPDLELDCWTLAPVRPKRLLIAIGPEGDFSPEEMALYRDRGGQVVSLGPSILKSDTAAVYALSVLQFLSRQRP